MAQLFYDNFGGSGSINGRTPDVPISGVTWANISTGLTMSGGDALTATASPGSSGNAVYGSSGGSYGLPADTTTTFYITTTANALNPSYAGAGFYLTIFDGGLSASFFMDFDGTDWTLSDSVTSVVVTVAASTTYSGTYRVVGGTQTLTFLGQTLTTTDALVNGNGFAGMNLIIGKMVAVNSISTWETETMTGILTAPSPLMKGYFGSVARLAAPVGLVANTWGSVIALTAPMGVLRSVMHNSEGENAAALTAPMGVLEASFGGVAKLSAPKGTLAATGTVSGKITAALTAPMGVMAASGVGSPYSMTAQLRAPMGRMIGYSGAVAAIISPMGFVTSTGTTGGKMDAAIVAPLFELTATMTRGQTMSAELIAPMMRPVASMQAYLIAPMGQLTAIGHAVVTATYEAYAINLKHNSDKAVDEVTRYTNFPFTKIVRYKNSYFGLGSDGNLYLLEGTTDAGTAIPWSFKTGITDFGSSFEKTVVSAYFRGRMGASEKVQLYAGEKAAKVYNYSNPRGAKAQNYRQKFGLGIKDAYYALGASGSGVMELDAIETEIHEMTRRI